MKSLATITEKDIEIIKMALNDSISDMNTELKEEMTERKRVALLDFKNKYSKFTKHWSPKIIAEMNDYQFKLAKIKGEFIWHDHKHTDETFIVIEGEMSLKFRNYEIKLSKGEMYVVPKGVEHKPCAENECKILVIEPKGVINTGDSGGKLTINEEIWI